MIQNSFPGNQMVAEGRGVWVYLFHTDKEREEEERRRGAEGAEKQWFLGSFILPSHSFFILARCEGFFCFSFFFFFPLLCFFSAARVVFKKSIL